MCIRDSVHTATAWRILENYTRIPVEHIMIERIKQNKSLVDIKLTARAVSYTHLDVYKRQTMHYAMVKQKNVKLAHRKYIG